MFDETLMPSEIGCAVCQKPVYMHVLYRNAEGKWAVKSCDEQKHSEELPLDTYVLVMRVLLDEIGLPCNVCKGKNPMFCSRCMGTGVL